MVFIKNPDLVRGAGDLGWHADDGVGGHPVLCPMTNVGVQLDVASAQNGRVAAQGSSYAR